MKRLAYGWSDDAEPVQFSLDETPKFDADAMTEETGLDFAELLFANSPRD